MAQKRKERHPCNLLKLREELKLTQKQLGEILEVSERMICNYETGEITLPIDKALVLSKKYGYSLDWIYLVPVNAPSEKVVGYTKFIVDIRHFLSFSNDSVLFTIPNYYWEYIKKRNAITSSKSLDEDKKRRIAELNGTYEVRENEQKY